MKNKIKNNRVLLVLALVLIVCFILLGIILFKYFYVGNSNKYGERLSGIENHPVHSSLETEIKELYTEEQISNVSYTIKGKIIYVTFDLAKVIKNEEAKSLITKSLDKFTEDEKGFYDIQFIVECSKEDVSTENKLYPIMGYKNSSSSVIVWTGR